MIESLNHCKRVRRLLLLCFLTMSESHERMSPLSLQRRPLSIIQNGEETEAYKTSLFLSSSSPTVRTNISMRGGGLISYIKASKSRCWALLVVSIMIEAAATTLNKRASDTQSAQLFAGSCILFLICVAGFNVGLSQIDVSVAYALWSALGTVLVSTAGVLFFGESYDAVKLLCIALIIVGVVGLNIRETH